MPRLVAALVGLTGLALRIEHAVTFDALARGADYERHIAGVRWMMQHWRPFDFTPALDISISYQAPLWYMAAALVLKVTGSVRAVTALAVAGWVVRHVLLARLLRQAIPRHRWAAVVALTIHAFLPISVQTDGEANPETLSSTLFTAAVYVLWHLERQAKGVEGIRTRTAVAFGALAGLSVLTKGTGVMLPMAAAVVVGVRAWRLRPRIGWRELWRRFLRPMLPAVAAWCLVAGWWCGPNLYRYGHPFPHAWDHTLPPELSHWAETPNLYRRPLGWALPFFWSPYWFAPIMMNADTPRTNLWAMLMAGTWADSINRGFCRPLGGGVHREFWDGWPISHRCVSAMAAVFRLGCLVAAATVLAAARLTRAYLKSDGEVGTLALPVVMAMGTAFPALFALVYPADGTAVVNARYLLPISTAMAACLALGMAGSRRPRLVYPVMLLAAAAIAALVIWQRWG